MFEKKEIDMDQSLSDAPDQIQRQAEALSGSADIDWDFHIQVCDQHKQLPTVLNVIRDDGTAIAIKISDEDAENLKELGVGSEG